MSLFYLSVLAADKKFYQGECESLVLPTTEGQYGILAHHSNMIAAVVPGQMMFRTPDHVEQHVVVSEGIVKVEDNDVLVLVDTIERPEEIDENRARQAADEARERMLQKRNIAEYRSAQAQLTRAMSRLKGRSNYENQNPLR